MRFLILCSALLASLSHADWKITEPSSLTFLSTKNSDITEVHHFRDIKGTLADNGYASMTINLRSVDTGIEVRNERMQSMLFEVSDFAEAKLTTNVDPVVMEKLEEGDLLKTEIRAKLSLHGEEVTFPAHVIVTPASDGSLTVSSSEPVLIHADQFGLVAGINKLRDVAKLKHIATVVPVSFTLTLKPQ